MIASTTPSRARQRLSLTIAFAGLGALASCVTFNMMSTLVSAPDLWPSRVDQLPEDFGESILTFVVWEKFEYVYGEGGEETLGLLLAPPRILRRDELARLGQHTKNFSFSRKTVDGTDEGSWERGHRAHGLLLISSTARTASYLTGSDPPRDFSISWWPLSESILSPEDASSFARAVRCLELPSDRDDCALGPLGELVEADLLRNIESEVPALTLVAHAQHWESAARFLEGLY